MPLTNKLPFFLLIASFLIFFYFSFVKKLFKNTGVYLSLAIIFSISFIFITFGFYPDGYQRFSRIVRSSGVTSYYNDMQNIINVSEFLKNYVKNIPTLHMHSQTHPPGPILYFYLTDLAGRKVNQTFNLNLDLAGFGGMIVPILGAFAMVPLYVLVRNLHSTVTARISVLIYCLVPSIIFFTTELDQLYSLFFILIILFYYLGVKRKSMVYFLLAGLFLFAGMFFSFLFLVIPVVLLLLATLIYLKKESECGYFFKIKNFVKYNLLFAVGFLVPMIIYQSIYGYNLYDVYKATMIYHGDFLDSKNYLVWVFMNLFDFFLFLGIPLAVIYLFGLAKEISNFLSTRYINVSFWLFTFIILILDLMGKNRSEVSRIWIFLIPLAVVSIANYISESKNKNVMLFVTIVLMVIQILVFRRYVQVIGV